MFDGTGEPLHNSRIQAADQARSRPTGYALTADPRVDRWRVTRYITSTSWLNAVLPQTLIAERVQAPQHDVKYFLIESIPELCLLLDHSFLNCTEVYIVSN